MFAVMDWQQSVSLVIVAAAGVLLLAGRLRRRRQFSFHRDTHCGCAAMPQSGPQSSSSIVFRARKGQRPQVLLKMR